MSRADLDAAAAGLRVELEAAKHELENERRGRLDRRLGEDGVIRFRAQGAST